MTDVCPRSRSALVAFVSFAVVSAAMLTVRLFAATSVGFGDAEALYATYALHPQPAYLDHPGLVGVWASAIGAGTAPAPDRAHAVTSLFATVVPWLMALACRACRATWARSWIAALVVACIPEMAIGLFAMTPDVLLAVTWTGAIAFAALALRSPVGSAAAAFAFGAAGVCAGAAAASKASGVTLLLAIGVSYGSRACRPHARTTAPWTGLAAGAVVVAPVVWFECHHGWPMLRHRLVDTQAAAGLSLRNAGALVGGQLLYLSPIVAWLAVLAARELWRDRGDALGSLLFACCVLPLLALVPLCLWSRVAEPHWIAPALLALVPAAARAQHAPSRRAVVASCALGATIAAAAYTWVLTPSLLRFAPASYEPQLDLANELYGWPDAIRVVREEALAAQVPGAQRGDVTLVGPHWVVCAQLDAAFRSELPVGCDTPTRDDFDDWWPRSRWRRAETIVWVTDGRFGPPPALPTHTLLRTRTVRVFRGGREVRVFEVAVLVRRALV